ncbi:MAG: paraquat-inducible protein A [Candidatus Competibacterales bacterium]|nr:paraquat-inducible protein A [Candidatus Competibacterales bacterium]
MSAASSFGSRPRAGITRGASTLACACCGQVQQLPEVPSGFEPVCCRCGARLRHADPARSHWTAALALAALVLYPAALLLPLLRFERLGHVREDSLLGGIATLWQDGQWLLALVVLLFSVVLPPLKLTVLLVLTGPGRPVHRPHRRRLYRLVDWLGRWGMLDVLLAALLVAFVKLGGLLSITPGPGLLAFAGVVLLSLLASFCFDPRLLWDEP